MKFVLIFSVLCFTQTTITSAVIFRKCCPVGQNLDADGECTESFGNSTDEFSWLPKTAMEFSFNNRTSVELDNSFSWLKGKIEVEFGLASDCNTPMTHVHHFAEDFDREFELLVNNEEETIKAVVKVPTRRGKKYFRELVIPMAQVCLDSAYDAPWGHVLMYCSSTPYIPKCCPLQQMINGTVGKCVPSSYKDWTPDTVEVKDKFPMMAGVHPTACSQTSFAEYDAFCDGYPRYFFADNGSISHVRQKWLYPGEYCGETNFYPEGVLVHFNIVFCEQRDREVADNPKKYLLVYTIPKMFAKVMMTLSCLLLVLTLLTFVLIRNLRKKIHDKLALIHLLNLLIADLIWTKDLFYPRKGRGKTAIFLMSLHFSYTSAFTWLNVMCFNLAKTIGTANNNTLNRSDTKKLLKWSLYGYGFPAIMHSYVIVMNFTEYSALPSYLPRPHHGCIEIEIMVRDHFRYYISVLGFSLFLNSIMFMYTVFKILRIRRETEILRREGSDVSGAYVDSDKQRVILFTKLFFLMGVSFVFEVYCWGFELMAPLFSVPADAMHLFRSICLFIMYVGKKRIWVELVNISGIGKLKLFFYNNPKLISIDKRLSHVFTITRPATEKTQL